MASAVTIALGILPDGTREILGLWIEQSGRDQTTVRGTVVPDHGAKFWLRVMNELKARGVQDILIAVTDGLKGFPEAITAVRRARSPPDCLLTLLTPRHRGSDLHRSSGPPFPGLHLLEGSEGRDP